MNLIAPFNRITLLAGVSALALMGSTLAATPSLAQMGGGNGQGNSQDLDPDGGMRNECGESGGCAEAGESIESRTPDELGDEADEDRTAPAPLAVPQSQGGGLGDGDSVTGTLNDGPLGE
ncbi:MAG TPA: hypothetical protein PLR41_13095 [Alphaproteobacteria bacterium]|nr:hypothetical protein [Alphaproteobacteria bacterium]